MGTAGVEAILCTVTNSPTAVCSDPAHRGHGLGTRLLLAVAAGIRDRGETPFLHVLESDVDTVWLYQRLGFRLRLRTKIVIAAQP
ncbi:MAG TPA: GNAT family N-acetyltransferase [Amycolatopsis sp.]